MADDIQILIDSLRRGQYEDPREKIALLSAALQEQNAATAVLVSLLRAPQIPLRLAALDALRERAEPGLLAEAVKLAQDQDTRVRLKLAQILQSQSRESASGALNALLADPEAEVRAAALKTTGGCAEFRLTQEQALANDTDWTVRLAAANSLDQQTTPVVVRVLLQAIAQDSDEDVVRRCAEAIERRLARALAATEKHLPSEAPTLAAAEKKLKDAGGQRLPKLMGWLAARTTVAVDPQVLARYGTDLSAAAKSGSLPHAHSAESFCAQLLSLIQREPWRSIALLGPAGSGKSALVNELVYELTRPENGAWSVLRVSPTDFMAGTKYLGEWETKVRSLVEDIRKPRRVLLYVPSLSDLANVGKWSKSDSNVATALAPYLEDGSVLLLGESTQEEFERGLGAVSSLSRLFDKVLLIEASVESTRDILRGVRDEEKADLSDEILNQLQEVSDQFLNHLSRPGNAVTLLRSVIDAAKKSAEPITFRTILDAVSKSTGLPSDLLDDAKPLEPAAVRAFFENRIIGQPEAIEAMVDVVTLIKAGVTDPQKPFGVFLFIGPTGVGKTELARSVAEFIFGDPARLKRFDMSEFASTEGFTRLIGSNHENGLLTDAVRQNPFSVILLDEIEKSHVNVFDLCLQIFDAGRLTDGRGRTVDFRRTIVILTSNIGATVASPGLGFGAPASPAGEVDKDRTFRELSRVFRPEFLNRLDRIVQFRALSVEVAEKITRREIDLVLQRSGIRRRRLAVEIDPAVVSLLVREGYSPHFGARPLKRTIERLVLLPVARTISRGTVQGQAVLRLTLREGKVEPLVTAAQRPAATAKTPKIPEPSRDRIEELQDAFTSLAETVQPLQDRKSELITRTHEPGFFARSKLRQTTFDEIHKLDQFLNQYAGVGKALSGLRGRLETHPASGKHDQPMREKLAQLAAELVHLRFVAHCRDAADLGDGVMVVTLVDRNGSPQDSVPMLARMYQGLARRMRMTAEVLGECFQEKHDCAYLLLSGLGAYALAKREAGLHQIDRRYKERTPRAGKEVVREDREIVRVEVFPVGLEPSAQLRQRTKIRITPHRPATKRLIDKADVTVSAFDEASLRSLEFWTKGTKAEVTERALLLLQVQCELPPRPAGDEAIVRHYDVGQNPRVREVKTGVATTRLDRILEGDLSIFNGT